ncbi:MAG: hypothetical protein ABH889_00090 [Candidatus Portnoybacteria bacterium]
MKIFYLLTALSVFLVSHGLLLTKVEPVATYFFVFVWWFYIFLVDAFLFWKKGDSLIVRLKAKFPLLIVASACFWIFFEVLNLRIANWHYPGHSLSLAVKIIFGLFAFGSVIPGILETHELLQYIGLGRRLEFLGWERSKRLLTWRWWGRPHYIWTAAGIGMISLALLWPSYFFWAIWPAAIFILDPQVEKNKGNSMFSGMRRGNIRTFYRLCLTGLTCGMLWEIWNHWAGLKWVYEVPFVGGWKIFEMPLLGYFGYTFFAVGCYLYYELLRCYWRRFRQPTFV